MLSLISKCLKIWKSLIKIQKDILEWFRGAEEGKKGGVPGIFLWAV